jgi:hypothetical protein
MFIYNTCMKSCSARKAREDSGINFGIIQFLIEELFTELYINHDTYSYYWTKITNLKRSVWLVKRNWMNSMVGLKLLFGNLSDILHRRLEFKTVSMNCHEAIHKKN